MPLLDRKMYPTWHQNGAKWAPGISRKIPETAPGATKERYDAASSPQDHPRTSIGPPLDPKVPPGSSKRRTQDLQKTPKGPPKSSTGPKKCSQSSPKGAPAHHKKSPSNRIPFHAFLDALDMHFQCCASALTLPTSDHTTLQVVSKRTLKQYDNSSSPQKLQCGKPRLVRRRK